jgi:hypothetical protein
MTTFVFKDPSGRTHEVTGPAGATQEQAFGILQQRLDSTSAQAEVKPQREATPLDERIATGFMDPIVGLAQLAEKTRIPGAIRGALGIEGNMDDYVRQREADYVAPQGVDWGRMGGNVANPINFVAPEAGVLAKAIPVAGVAGRIAASPITRAAATGAAQSALAPVDPDKDFLTEKAKQMGVGGAVGGVASKVLPRVLGGLVRPTDEARALQRMGVDLTPGQAAGGMLNATEQKAMSIPIVGDFIAGGRRRALNDFQERALERATGTARGAGPKTVDEANTAVSDLYQQVVPKLKPTGEAAVDVLGAVAKAADNPELTDVNRKVLEGIHTKLFGHDGERYMQLSGDQLKRLDTELGVKIREYGKSVLPSDHVLADEIGNVQQAMRQAWRYHLDPADAAKLDAANTAYRKMVPVNKAASESGGAEEKVFPMAMRRALARQQGKDVTRAADDALVDPASKVLTGTVPDSGTAGRLGTPAAVLGGVSAPVASIVAALAAAGAYTRTGSNIITGNTRAQRWLAQQEPETRKALAAALRSYQANQQRKQD